MDINLEQGQGLPMTTDRGQIVSVSRRKLAGGVWLLALAGAALAMASEVMIIAPTQAQDISDESLMNPGPLADEVLGSKNAPVTIVEYASMTCLHCAQFANMTFPALKARYIDTGMVRYIFREFPLDGLAAAASMLARCAGDDRYFAVVQRLMGQQDEWLAERIQPLMTFATKQLGFTNDSFKACVTDGQLVQYLKNARDRASKIFQVRATPTFFINGKIQIGYKSIKEMINLIEPYVKT
jgi:protein-disulfide isomerase